MLGLPFAYQEELMVRSMEGDREMVLVTDKVRAKDWRALKEANDQVVKTA